MDFFKVKQTHGSDLVLINEASSTEIISEQRADGLIQFNSNKSLAIVTADCIPLVLIGKKGVAFLHAGWRGVYQKIFFNSIIRDIEPTLLFFGPSIRVCCFEVQNDFWGHFPNSQHHFTKRDNRLYFDLIKETTEQLLTRFPKLQISDSKICTHCTQNFHSYRCDKTKNRNWNILARIDK